MHQYRLQRFLLVFSTSQSLCCCCCCTVLWRHGISQWVTWHGYTAAGARKAVERTGLSVRTIKCLIARVHLVTMSFLYVKTHYVQLIGPNCIFLPRAFHLYANTDFGIKKTVRGLSVPLRKPLSIDGLIERLIDWLSGDVISLRNACMTPAIENVCELRCYCIVFVCKASHNNADNLFVK